MEKLRILFLALILGVFFIPFSIYIRKFSKIEAYEKPVITFNPYECYLCKDCPCVYELDDVEYRLSRLNKPFCDLPVEVQRNALLDPNRDYTVYLNIKEHKLFEECLKWYSLHPTVY